MKPLGIVSTGIFVFALAVLGASVYADQPRLCMQVIAKAWAKKHNATPDMYIQQTADSLHVPAASLTELNEAREKSTADAYAKDHSPEEAAQRMEIFRRRASCK